MAVMDNKDKPPPDQVQPSFVNIAPHTEAARLPV
jgi:hypothetical protein